MMPAAYGRSGAVILFSEHSGNCVGREESRALAQEIKKILLSEVPYNLVWELTRQLAAEFPSAVQEDK